MSEPREPVNLGATGELVRANVRRIRTARGLTYAELSRRLERIGRPIAPLGLTRIETGFRRVDVDDLIALTQALSCTVADLSSSPCGGCAGSGAVPCPDCTPKETP